MTVSQAISAGGGLTPRGTERRATVKRRNEQGKEVRISVKGSDLLRAGRRAAHQGKSLLGDPMKLTQTLSILRARRWLVLRRV